MVLPSMLHRPPFVLIAGYLLVQAILSCALFIFVLIFLVSTSRSQVHEQCNNCRAAHEGLFRSILRAASVKHSSASFVQPDPLLLLRDPPEPSIEKLVQHEQIRHYANEFMSCYHLCQVALNSSISDDFSTPKGRLEAAGFLRRLSPAERVALEFQHTSRYPIDGVLNYLFGVIGFRSKIAVELDTARGSAVFFGATSLALYSGWDVVALYGLWSGYSRAQQFYESSARTGAFEFRKKHFADSNVIVSEGPIDSQRINVTLQQLGVGGSVDILFLMLDGAEWSVWDSLSRIRPRVVVFFYQDFWGADASFVREWNTSDRGISSPGESDGVDLGRKRLFAGASVTALIRLTEARGFRLVWCLSSAPIVLFVQNREDPSRSVLPSLPPAACLAARQGRTWRRDMEAQWHRAQQFAWTSV